MGFIVFHEDFLQVSLGSIQNPVDDLRHGGPGRSEREGVGRMLGKEFQGQREDNPGLGTNVAGERDFWMTEDEAI